MNELIQQKLLALEADSGIRILYACESGSRAWGFASDDSDYDIRFIYVWPRERYLGIFPPADVLDYEIDDNDLDLSGWDLKKALPLFRKANGPLFEWISSPIVYFQDEEVMAKWRALVERYFVPGHSAAHYLGLSRKINGRIQEGGETTAKKYLYVLRALLSARFVAEYGKPPLVDFACLREQLTIPPNVQDEIDGIIRQKASGSEGDRIPRNSTLDTFIEEQSRISNELVHSLPSEMGPVEPLDEFFRSVIS